MYCTLDLPSHPEFQSPPGLSHFHYGIPVSLYLWLLLGGGRSNMYISPETLLLQTNHHTFQRIWPCLEKESNCSPWYSWCYTLAPNKPFPRRSQSLARWHFNWAFRKKLRKLHVQGFYWPSSEKESVAFLMVHVWLTLRCYSALEMIKPVVPMNSRSKSHHFLSKKILAKRLHLPPKAVKKFKKGWNFFKWDTWSFPFNTEAIWGGDLWVKTSQPFQLTVTSNIFQPWKLVTHPSPTLGQSCTSTGLI